MTLQGEHPCLQYIGVEIFNHDKGFKLHYEQNLLVSLRGLTVENRNSIEIQD